MPVLFYKLHQFEFKSLEDLQIFLKRYLYLFQIEDGAGALLVLYSCVLSRGLENVKKDLDGKLSHLVSAQVEGSINVVTLLLTGRATPYLHNGVLYVGDEDHYAMPQFGILSRSPVGLLVWYGGEENAKAVINKQFPGFDIHYYTCGGCHVLLNVDTRTHDDAVGPLRNDDISATPLEKLIHTKWQDAKITWTGATPYVGESPK
ncbi:unnamed protein product [Arctia plantaginis]|uniref:Ubiquitin carboxyl-terminal hydrolase MINDY n=1 Tax=Arctia plantaginis TaxID=874455 RepID=A0A8S1BCK7_ARCPL|nr:unnamed protein product [Arctia plantaginis]